MSAAQFSRSWHRVSQLRPRLRPHARIARHSYRGRPWYVMCDPASGRHHRFSHEAHLLIQLMDGARSVDEIWQAVGERLGPEAPTQEEVIEVLGRLHAADVLQCDVPPDVRDLFSRHRSRRRRNLASRFFNPLAMRIPLLDPDRYLQRMVPLARHVFSRAGLAAWLLVVAAAALACMQHWPQLAEHARQNALAPANLLLLALVYPLVKTVHELGHALATRVRGGEVHEIGVMLLVFMPVPYVDASSASLFEDRAQRMLVGAVGIMAEIFLAALGLFVWLAVEPGIVRDVAFNVMLIGGVSTLFFNGNPLLRFDGYYVLADAVEIPNLGPRSVRYYGYLAQKYLLGIGGAVSPAYSRGEVPWFLFYAAAAFVYRLFILFVIVFMVIERFLVAGVILAAWAIATQLLWPAGRWLAFVVASPQTGQNRARAIAATSIAVLAAAALLLVPLPSRTLAQGLVWLPEQSHVRAGSDGIVLQVHAVDGSPVSQGQLLVEAGDPFVATRVRLLQAQLDEHRARFMSRQYEDKVEARIIEDEMKAAQAELDRMLERQDALLVRAPSDGVFILPGARDLEGRYLEQGEVFGYVVDFSQVTARVVVEQEEVALVRAETHEIEMRLADKGGEVIRTSILREVPGASRTLPGRALGSGGGGDIAVDPLDPDGTHTLASVFQFDLALPAAADATLIGSRVHVRFDHGLEPVGSQWYRRMRQLLLRRIGV